jgi:hypothetical protein
VTLFGGSAYEVLFIYRNRLHYTTETNCQKVEVPGTITLKKWGARTPMQAPMVTMPMVTRCVIAYIISGEINYYTETGIAQVSYGSCDSCRYARA